MVHSRQYAVVKVKDKIKVLHSLLHICADVICIGGRLAFTFLAAEGVAVGRTQIEEEWWEVRGSPLLPACHRCSPPPLQPCNTVRQLAKERGMQLLLPEDVVVASSSCLTPHPPPLARPACMPLLLCSPAR